MSQRQPNSLKCNLASLVTEGSTLWLFSESSTEGIPPALCTAVNCHIAIFLRHTGQTGGIFKIMLYEKLVSLASVRQKRGTLTDIWSPSQTTALHLQPLSSVERNSEGSAAPMLQLWFEGLMLHTAIPKHVGGLHLGTSILPGKQ